ncbi:pilus assembly protein CpaD [Novosphingobium sp. FSY-8]|uniref:Pilus assembly protein CpaD n=2 Tax=Novosphingobium ovatum TaxID=1908523 RepID=A0ABW9XEC0_9SPHN|nr:pilus assembly protein CpaD [Novosphingobium ovatum]
MIRSLRAPLSSRRLGLALMLPLGLALSACAGMPNNRLLDSVHQPVVTRTSYTLDLNTGTGGLPYAELKRLDGWLSAMNLHYGDSVAVEDPLRSPQTRAAIQAMVEKRGLQLAADAPATEGYVSAGTARVVLSRSTATVPHCPDWQSNAEANPRNATASNYGCAINSNLAAMVANPDHLLSGATGHSHSEGTTSDKAIATYRAAKPTGEGGLKKSGS